MHLHTCLRIACCSHWRRNPCSAAPRAPGLPAALSVLQHLVISWAPIQHHFGGNLCLQHTNTWSSLGPHPASFWWQPPPATHEHLVISWAPIQHHFGGNPRLQHTSNGHKGKGGALGLRQPQHLQHGKLSIKPLHCSL
jgi:hypothetical protein